MNDRVGAMARATCLSAADLAVAVAATPLAAAPKDPDSASASSAPKQATQAPSGQKRGGDRNYCIAA